MANNQKQTETVAHKLEPLIQNNMSFQNNGNSKTMQVNVQINNTINFNVARQILPSNDHNTRTVNMNMNMNRINVQQQQQQEDENDDNESESDQDTDEESIDMEFLTPPTSQNNNRGHAH